MTPDMVFSAVPLQPAEIPQFFNRADVRKLLQFPPTLRQHGWDLRVGEDNVSIVPDGFEGRLAGRIVKLHSDGTLLAKVPVDESFLNWGRDQDQPPRLNPLALAEFVYNFVTTYAGVTRLFDPPIRSVRLGVKIRGAKTTNFIMRLAPYRVSSIAWQVGKFAKEAPASDADFGVDVDARFLQDRPEAAGFMLLEIIYRWFSVPPEEIPYSEARDGQRVISKAEMMSPNG